MVKHSNDSDMKLIGQTFGHIRIVEKIGEGGMGAVFGAFDEKLQREIRDRFAGAFPGCTAIREPEWGNVLLFGTATRKGHGALSLTSRARALSKARGLPFQLGKMASTGDACGAVSR